MADNLIQPVGTGITTPERTAEQIAQALTGEI